jgi:hypothetical protein
MKARHFASPVPSKPRKAEEQVFRMNLGQKYRNLLLISTLIAAFLPSLHATPRKVHVVALGGVRRVPYSKAGDPAGAVAGENALRIRPLVVDGMIKEWTTGEAHEVTERSFVVRRVLRLNDELPGERANSEKHWVWQRGPWLLVDRVTGHITALKLPDYDPGVSQGMWFRDYGAYCGLSASGKNVYAVVAQLAARKPVLAKKLTTFDSSNRTEPVCAPVEWQRQPLRATFHATGKDAVSFDLVPGSAVLVEESDAEAEPNPAAKSN